MRLETATAAAAADADLRKLLRERFTIVGLLTGGRNFARRIIAA